MRYLTLLVLTIGLITIPAQGHIPNPDKIVTVFFPMGECDQVLEVERPGFGLYQMPPMLGCLAVPLRMLIAGELGVQCVDPNGELQPSIQVKGEPNWHRKARPEDCIRAAPVGPSASFAPANLGVTFAVRYSNKVAPH